MAVTTEVSPDLIVRRLLEAGYPEKIVLFGGRCRDTAHERSDYDLLVIQRSQEPRFARAGRYYCALSDLPIEVDIVVVTPDEVLDWQSVPQAFITTALREGRTLYERQA